MNNKEFLTELGRRTGLSDKKTSDLVNSLLADVTESLEEENSVCAPNFGILEVKKKLERVLINPTTKQKMLVPPKMVVNFRTASALKDKVNQ